MTAEPRDIFDPDTPLNLKLATALNASASGHHLIQEAVMFCNNAAGLDHGVNAGAIRSAIMAYQRAVNVLRSIPLGPRHDGPPGPTDGEGDTAPLQPTPAGGGGGSGGPQRAEPQQVHEVNAQINPNGQMIAIEDSAPLKTPVEKSTP